MTATRSISQEDQFALNMAREAKQIRDDEGRPDARGDAVLAWYEAGVFSLPDEFMSTTPDAYLEAHDRPVGPLTRVGDHDHDQDEEFKGRRGGEPASNQFGTFVVHTASPKQIAFVKRLLAEKDYSKPSDTLGAIKVPADIDTISKKSASALIDRLMGCPDKATTAEVSGTANGPLASDKQMGFLRKLIAERDYYSLGEKDRGYVDAVRNNPDARPTKRGASALIDVPTKTAYADATSRTSPAQPSASATDAPVEVGMYRKANGEIFRVYPAQNGGHLLAKRLINNGVGVKADWEYAGAAGRFVQASERMTLEEAKSYGREYAICCVCGALLENTTSVALGIGPVCGGRV